MASGGALLVKQAKKFREVDSLQHEKVPNVAEALEKYSKFLQEHETPSMNDCTHTVFDNFPDWWMGTKPLYKLAIAEDNTLDIFYKCISVLYDLGIPLTLTEKRTSEIRFLQDIEIWGTKDNAITAEELMGVENKFVWLLGKAMGEIYPKQEFLDAVIFDATGMSRTKGVMKTSVRFVWSSIVVNKDRAAQIRDYVVCKFKDCKEEEIRALEARVLGYNKDNQWNGIFGDAIYFGRFGIRMPLCDRVSPAPLKKPEQRPFKPVGVVRFSYAGGTVKEVERLCGTHDLEGEEWLKIGCIRRDAGTALTEWTLPTWKGERAPRPSAPSPSLNSVIVNATGRAPGQVKIRTKSGSDDGTRARLRDPQKSAADKERLVTVEREFEGTVDEFREKLETQLGRETTITQTEGSLVWRQADDNGARIEFKASNRRVYIIGKAHQIRSLLNAIAAFAKAVSESARSATTNARSVNSHRAGSEYGAPGSVFAPSAVAPSAVYAISTASRVSSQHASGAACEPSKRIVIRAFQPETASELTLAENDLITVTHDPEGSQHNVHRWVYGQNETSGKHGWFPNSCTRQLQPMAEGGAAIHEE